MLMKHFVRPFGRMLPAKPDETTISFVVDGKSRPILGTDFDVAGNAWTVRLGPAPCDRSGRQADETGTGSASGESTVIGEAEQAPDPHPLGSPTAGEDETP